MTKLEELELTELKELKAELLVLTSMAKGDIRAWAVDEISRIEAIVKLRSKTMTKTIKELNAELSEAWAAPW